MPYESPMPTGSEPESLFMQTTHERTQGPMNKLRNTPDISWQRGPKGLFPRFKRRPAGAAPAASVSIQQFILRHTDPSPSEGSSVQSEFVSCYQAGDDSQAPVSVAKPEELRCSLVAETIDGVAFAYVYDPSFVVRAATGNGATESQDLVPRYITGRSIWAVQVPQILSLDGTVLKDTRGNVITWLDLNLAARYWAESDPQ